MKIDRRKFLQYTPCAGAATWCGLPPLRPIQYPQPQPTPYRAALRSVGPAAALNQQCGHPFGPYLGRKFCGPKGLNLFQAVEIQTLTPEILKSAVMVVLAEGPVTPEQVQWPRRLCNGGRQPAWPLRPEAGLFSLVGRHRRTASPPRANLKLEPTNPLQPADPRNLQFHGEANHYRPVEADVIAWLYADRSQSTTGRCDHAATRDRVGPPCGLLTWPGV